MSGKKKENFDMQDLITRTQAATLRGVSRAAIADLISRGRLQVIEIAGREFLSRREIEKFEPEKGGRPRKDAGDKKGGKQ